MLAGLQVLTEEVAMELAGSAKQGSQVSDSLAVAREGAGGQAGSAGRGSAVGRSGPKHEELVISPVNAGVLDQQIPLDHYFVGKSWSNECSI